MDRSAEIRRAERELKAIKALINSDGWAVIEDVMKNEIMAASLQLSDPSFVEESKVNFYRGALWAAAKLLNVPHRIRQTLEAQITLSATARQNEEQ